MHYLVVAKVKDYPDVNDIAVGMCRHTHIVGKGDMDTGKWKNIKDDFPILWLRSPIIGKYITYLYALQSRNPNKVLTDKDGEKAECQCIKDSGFWVEDEDVYAKVSGYFDYIIPGGDYDMGTEDQKAKYKDVIAKYGKVDAFVLPDFECRFTKHRDVECSFQDDDEVWVLDGYTYCNW